MPIVVFALAITLVILWTLSRLRKPRRQTIEPPMSEDDVMRKLLHAQKERCERRIDEIYDEILRSAKAVAELENEDDAVIPAIGFVMTLKRHLGGIWELNQAIFRIIGTAEERESVADRRFIQVARSFVAFWEDEASIKRSLRRALLALDVAFDLDEPMRRFLARA